MRSRIRRSMICFAALTTTAMAAAFTATPALADPVCIPEAPVCAGIAGQPGDYRFTFTFRPPPDATGVSFAVNGTFAAGTVTTQSGPGYLHGDYWPFTPLLTGDEVCMSYSQFFQPGQVCDTVP
ncbi:hypothetical protein [Actinomadura sp. 7K534]|uniref:hypothetical protein n=1 Tax=Actinomadura sp. 7K534 TaxID=2530366 RepID=UPI00104E8873|nr:hypothetical protein [Actinomadura sp. 7K534]TDB96167.1 hypothetical protein E1266_10750 [Actinomadura sp. 7K534]